MAKRVGRPMKYRHFLTILKDDQVYTPGSIVRFGESLGLMNPDLQGDELKWEKVKIRHTLARFSTNHMFPKDGDGWVSIKGQPAIRGWFGRRWKEALPDES